MAQKTSGLRAVLAQPVVYETFQRLVGSRNVRRTLLDEHLRPRPGQRILDIGCGPGDILEHLPEAEYVGFDLSEAYVRSARERYGDRGEFFVGDVSDVDASALGTFDRVLAKGVLHHLSDDEASRLLRLAARVLRPDGVLATIDPCFAPAQSRLARYVVSRDRGQNVRRPDEYLALAKRSFGDVEVSEYHHLLRIPYSHATLVCRTPLEGDTGTP